MNFLYKIRFVKYIIKRSILKQLKLNCPLPASILLTNEISRDFTIFQNFNLFCKIRFVEYLIKRSILKRLKSNCQLAASILFTNEILPYFKIWTYFAIITNKLDTFSGINRWTTEETLFNPHFRVLLRGQGLLVIQ